MVRFFLVPIAVLLCQSLVFAETLTLAGGKGYKRPLSEIAQAYEKSGGGKIDQLYGTPAQIIMQAEAGGNVAFVVAGSACLKSSGLEFAEFYDLGEGVMVIAFGKEVKLERPEDLLKPEITKVAIPDQKRTGYGRAGEEFLRKTGLLDKLEKKLLVVSTLPQVTSYLISGDVDAGFINLTEALYVRDKIGGYITPDRASYEPIMITLGVIRKYENDPEAKKFLNFLATSSEAKEILKKAGLQAHQ